VQPRVERRNVGIAPVGDRRQERVVELPVWMVRNTSLSLPNRSWLGVIHQVRTAEAGAAVPVAHAQQRRCRKMAAHRLAADRQHVGAELRLALRTSHSAAGSQSSGPQDTDVQAPDDTRR